MAEVIAELVKVLPENDWMKLALLVFALLLIVLREKLFTGIVEIYRYLFRWIGCRIGRHTWVGGGAVISDSVNYSWSYCYICQRTKRVE